ncbi:MULTISPECIES: LacI family DNA-binding transcriptional regulator [Agrobacterium]|uniref:LacI family DNA-binding transcriptional regulator n=1 Tax=Agrobacterium TaxID=357 RepID=UPI00080FCA89|nr:LacI family DNA-binding transcriptional regulator [Agrobacterium sp. 13-2099-1-2]NSY46508.1 LacI family transcriptional regulator [Agrobacterium tumefaciens]UZX45252.1 LacI family DNA-binding transcriptional regulator [Agrobacterium sp. 13-2099-1-2]
MSKKTAPHKAAVVGIRDVAREAGVSTMTVTNAFKYPDKVVAETRNRVIEVAQRLNYVPNLVAAGFSSGKTKVVAAITPSIRNSNFAGMIMGLEHELEKNGYHLIVSVVETPAREYDAVMAVIGRRVDGIVLTGVDRDDKTRRLLQQTGIPIVETWNLSGPFVDIGVGFSTQTAAREATQIMVDKGLSNIGVAGYDTHGNKRFQERLDGFLEALTLAGLRTDLIATVPGWSGFSGGKDALERLHAIEPKLDGVFCFTDVLAAGVIFECMRKGINVPKDLAVVGYGDYEIAAELPPGLTTVHTPGDLIGEHAARMVMARCRGEVQDIRVVDVGYNIVVRGSTG